jgi:hypothetical protein
LSLRNNALNLLIGRIGVEASKAVVGNAFVLLHSVDLTDHDRLDGASSCEGGVVIGTILGKHFENCFLQDSATSGSSFARF